MIVCFLRAGGLVRCKRGRDGSANVEKAPSQTLAHNYLCCPRTCQEGGDLAQGIGDLGQAVEAVVAIPVHPSRRVGEALPLDRQYSWCIRPAGATFRQQATFWKGFEVFLVEPFLDTMQVVTSHTDPMYPTGDNQAFLRVLVYRLVRNRACGKMVPRT